jgi:hypothetical protein
LLDAKPTITLRYTHANLRIWLENDNFAVFTEEIMKTVVKTMNLGRIYKIRKEAPKELIALANVNQE